MFQRAFIVYFVTAIFFYNSIIVTDEANEKNINDTIIELFNNCSCVPYYQCSEINKYMYQSRSNFGNNVIVCSNPDFICCKKITSNNTETDGDDDDDHSKQNSDEVLVASVRSVNISSRTCGITKTKIGVRILNSDDDSVDTIPGEFPWIVEIFIKTNNPQKPYRFICGGSLIHPKVVLTVTHCIISNIRFPQKFKIVATGEEVFQFPGTNIENDRNVVKIIYHPDYYFGGLYNDISLLILDREYNFTNTFLNTICLPKKTEIFENRRCISAGWGSKPQVNQPLRKVDLPVLNFDHCQNLLRKSRLGLQFNLHSSFICAGGEEGKDTCKGDGGGPLMCFNENQFVQIGIISWGLSQKCGIIDEPGVYTNLTKFTDWIENQLSENNIKLN